MDIGVGYGFRLGRELRRRDPRGTLVYITSYEDLAWRTFQYHLEAFDYIVKGPEPHLLNKHAVFPAGARGSVGIALQNMLIAG